MGGTLLFACSLRFETRRVIEAAGELQGLGAVVAAFSYVMP